MDSGIYKIENQLNGKVYIGSSYNIRERLTVHKWYLKNNNHVNSHLQDDWNIYNKNVFDFRTIIYCNKHQLAYYEQRFLDYYLNEDKWDQTYNISKDAITNRLSEETLDKIRGKNHYNWKGGKDTIECSYCEKTLSRYPKNINKLNFCDKSCMSKYYTTKIKTTCEYCGEEYKVKQYRKGETRFCGHSCRSKQTLSGEGSGNVKLNKNEAKMIKLLAKNRVATQRYIGKVFNVSRQLVCDINNGRAWSHI